MPCPSVLDAAICCGLVHRSSSLLHWEFRLLLVAQRSPGSRGSFMVDSRKPGQLYSSSSMSGLDSPIDPFQESLHKRGAPRADKIGALGRDHVAAGQNRAPTGMRPSPPRGAASRRDAGSAPRQRRRTHPPARGGRFLNTLHFRCFFEAGLSVRGSGPSDRGDCTALAALARIATLAGPARCVRQQLARVPSPRQVTLGLCR